MENISIASDIIHELTGWRLRDDFYLFDSTSFLVYDVVIIAGHGRFVVQPMP